MVPQPTPIIAPIEKMRQRQPSFCAEDSASAVAPSEVMGASGKGSRSRSEVMRNRTYPRPHAWKREKTWPNIIMAMAGNQSALKKVRLSSAAELGGGEIQRPPNAA